MKHVIICGTCRSGKTLLALKLKELVPELNYLSADIATLALKKVSDKDFARKDVSEFQDFLYEIYYRYKKYNEGYLMIEGVYIKGDDSVLKYNSPDTIIVFVGRPQLTPEESFNEIRESEKHVDSWTKSKTDEHILRMTKGEIAEDKRNLEFCKQHGFYFLDTSHNRMTAIENFAKELAKNLNKT